MNDMMHGNAKHITFNGDVYEGSWLNGEQMNIRLIGAAADSNRRHSDNSSVDDLIQISPPGSPEQSDQENSGDHELRERGSRNLESQGNRHIRERNNNKFVNKLTEAGSQGGRSL